MAHLLYRATSTPTVPTSTTVKGIGLTNTEIDGNWKSLNDNKLEVSLAVSANTSNTVVLRDASGNFSAGTITASLAGNAATATVLLNSRTINGVSFNGSANINVPTQNTLTIGSYLTGSNFNGSSGTVWAVDATSALSGGQSKVVARDVNGDFEARIITVLDLNSTSDRNLKTNIQPVQDPMNIIDQLSGVSFDWKDGGKSSFGLIAQELQDVLPNLVSTSQSGHLVVNYIPIIAILIEAIKQQNQTIQQLLNK
jgi:hypothetical protein